jgi:SAM-dependent methyltransferase
MVQKLKSLKDSLLRKINGKLTRKLSRSQLHSYWKDPNDAFNSPGLYLQGQERSEFLLNLINKYLEDKEAPILEIGCNVGRNLHYLFEAGFTNLSGVEINENALEIMRVKFPKLADNCKIYNKSLEDWIKDFSSTQFELVFAMAVLEHVHKESEWVFPHISRITRKYLVLIEDEKQVSPRHFARNYDMIFRRFGLSQLEETNCANISGLDNNFVARVFVK